jgi:hypothetical protein
MEPERKGNRDSASSRAKISPPQGKREAPSPQPLTPCPYPRSPSSLTGACLPRGQSGKCLGWRVGARGGVEWCGGLALALALGWGSHLSLDVSPLTHSAMDVIISVVDISVTDIVTEGDLYEKGIDKWLFAPWFLTLGVCWSWMR